MTGRCWIGKARYNQPVATQPITIQDYDKLQEQFKAEKAVTEMLTDQIGHLHKKVAELD